MLHLDACRECFKELTDEDIDFYHEENDYSHRVLVCSCGNHQKFLIHRFVPKCLLHLSTF